MKIQIGLSSLALGLSFAYGSPAFGATVPAGVKLLWHPLWPSVAPRMSVSPNASALPLRSRLLGYARVTRRARGST